MTMITRIIIVTLAIVVAQVIGSLRINQGKASRHLLVVDTDAGADDAMAISLILNATRSTDTHVAGITCVRGNTGVHNVTKNVLRTLDVNQRLDIPVFEGNEFGLVSTSSMDSYFGDDGFGDFDYPVPKKTISSVHPAIFLANIVRKNPGRVTILAIGPLTNLAIAGLIYPPFYEKAKQIIFLGGSTSGRGGMEGVEFNVWADPSAAIAVFSRSPMTNPITVVPCDATHYLKYSWDWRKYVLGRKGTGIMNFLNLAERKEPLSPSGWKVDDPAAAAVFIDPTIVVSSHLGRPRLAANGTMHVTNDGNTVRIIDFLDKSKLKLMLEELL